MLMVYQQSDTIENVSLLKNAAKSSGNGLALSISGSQSRLEGTKVLRGGEITLCAAAKKGRLAVVDQLSGFCAG